MTSMKTFLSVLAAIVCGYLVIDALHYVAKEQQLREACNDLNSPFFASPYLCKDRMASRSVSKPVEVDSSGYTAEARAALSKLEKSAPVPPPPPPEKPVVKYTCTPGVPFGKCR